MKLKANKKVQFDDFTHTYLCGDKVLMGVTSLMKKHGLGADYSNIDPEVLAKAAERGSAIHKLLEDYDNGASVIEDENLKAYKKLGLNVICSEYLISDNETVASSIDKVLDCGEKDMVDLGDVKTTSTLHVVPLEWQLGIYKYLFEKQNPKIKVRKCWGIHIRNGKAKIVEIEPKDASMVEALFEADRNGVIYIFTEEQEHLASEAVTVEEQDQLISLEKQISELDKTIKGLKEVSEAIKSKIYDYMFKNNISELTAGDGSFVLKKPYTRVTLDSDKIKAEYPMVAEECSKTSTTKGSVTYKAKKS